MSLATGISSYRLQFYHLFQLFAVFNAGLCSTGTSMYVCCTLCCCMCAPLAGKSGFVRLFRGNQSLSLRFRNFPLSTTTATNQAVQQFSSTAEVPNIVHERASVRPSQPCVSLY